MLSLLAAMPVWPQTSTNATGTTMQTPPPVSGEAYPTEVGSEARSNYLHTGFTVNTAYSDNLLAGNGTNPISDISYSIWPTIALDQTTSRLHQTLRYSPGFTFYKQTSALNEFDQNLALDFEYRLSPHVTASLQDSFRKSSNVLNQPYPFSGGAILGSAQAPLVPVVAPIADQINNAANTKVTYQFSRNSMIGASGVFTNLDYPKPNEVLGLSNSNSRGVAGFYSYRLSQSQYFGVTYQYSQTQGSLPTVQNGLQNEADSGVQTHAILFFSTMYLKPNLSVSLSGGPQYYDISQSPYPEIRSWAPAATASIGWQGSRTSLAASYSHVVGGGGGLLGAFDSNSANASVRWQLARTWTIGSTAGYVITKNVSPFMTSSNPGGYMVSGTVMVQHPISEHFNMDFVYTRLHQSYNSIAVVSNAPNADRESISISYQFTRPLGR
jgi:hypothetical protein